MDEMQAHAGTTKAILVLLGAVFGPVSLACILALVSAT